MSPYPNDILLAITWRCNTRCKMCKVWAAPDVPELPPSEYRKIKNVKYINLTGGEPFLREDIVDIVVALKESGNKYITICTNGLVSNTIDKLKEIYRVDPKVRVVVSIDGIGKRHDEIRGVEGAFDMASGLLRELAARKQKNVHIGFTAGDYNIDQVMDVYRFAAEVKAQFSVTATYNSLVRYSTMENDIKDFEGFSRVLSQLIKAELGTASPKRWLRAYFTHGLLHFVKTGKRILPMGHPSRGVYIHPDGNVVLSLVSGANLGSIADCNELQDLFSNDRAKLIFKEVSNLPVPWLVSNVRCQMPNYIFPISTWILRKKFLPGSAV